MNLFTSGEMEKLFFTKAFRGAPYRLTRFSAVGENDPHGNDHSINTEPDSALGGPPRSPLHLVSAADEEASRRRQAVRPLHMPKVRLPAHHETRSETTQPRTLKPGLSGLFGLSRLFGGTK